MRFKSPTYQQERLMQISSKKVLFALLAALSACWGCAEATEWESRDLKVVDPDGDCRCVVRKGEAEISVPGTAHDLSAETGHVNAPRALCEMEGDFSVRVKTDCHLSPQTRTAPEGSRTRGPRWS